MIYMETLDKTVKVCKNGNFALNAQDKRKEVSIKREVG